MKEKLALEFNRIWYKHSGGDEWITMANKACEIIRTEIEKVELTDEQMFKLVADKESLKLLKQFPDSARVSSEYHKVAQAQLQKILDLLSTSPEK